MDWVKLTTDYYRDVAIAVGSEAAEVMFVRGLALAGEIEKHGFIPEAMLPGLARKPAQARKLASELVSSGLWEKVRGGYQIASWQTIQAELERIVERKARDRDRKRAERAAARESADSSALGGGTGVSPSTDLSADSPAPRPEDRLSGESKSKRSTAAARTGRGRSKPRDLPPAVAILRAALEAHKLVVGWNLLDDDQLAEIEELVGIHGDAPLVQSALRAYQPNKPAVYARAWLEDWRQLRVPGDLAAVPDQPCTRPGHTGTTRHCAQCAVEDLPSYGETRSTS